VTCFIETVGNSVNTLADCVRRVGFVPEIDVAEIESVGEKRHQ